MELKKSPKADLQNMKGLFLEIGLVIALAITGIAFALSSEKDVEEYEPVLSQVADFVEEDEMVRTDLDKTSLEATSSYEPSNKSLLMLP